MQKRGGEYRSLRELIDAPLILFGVVALELFGEPSVVGDVRIFELHEPSDDLVGEDGRVRHRPLDDLVVVNEHVARFTEALQYVTHPVKGRFGRIGEEFGGLVTS